jgi:hypothetical protein
MIPDSLAELSRWVAWRNEQRRGKSTKVPYAPNGRRAKEDDPSTWGTRDEAEARAAKLVNGISGGVGIQLGDLGDDVFLAGIDLDSCIDADGCLALWAEKILAELDTYAERSPSGSGVKVLFYIARENVRPFLALLSVTDPDQWGIRRSVGLNGSNHGPGVEISTNRRYFAITDDRWPGSSGKVHLLDWKTLQQLAPLVPEASKNRDSSRSAKAFREGARLKREGKTFEEMCKALRSHPDPEIREWVRVKGEADDMRQLRRIWDRAGRRNNRQPWHAELILNEKDYPKALLVNAVTALRLAPEWQGLCWFNAFHNQVFLRGIPPWSDTRVDEPWSDHFDNLTACWLQTHSINVGPEIADRAVATIAQDRRYHPVLDYLHRCVWDGTPRLDCWAITYLGAEDTPYCRAVASRWMISAVARVEKPGCKADCALILEGFQGLLKSSVLRTLAQPWFTDDLADFGTKDAALQLRGVWIIELPELDSISRTDVSRIKSFMSRATDRYRPPYGRNTIEQPRQNVFGGTVNHNEYLRDETGGRRFWPLACTKVDLDGLTDARDQLWAEALARYRKG